MDQEDFTQCKYCGLKRRYILNHLAQNLDCKKHYTEEEILALKISAKTKSDEKKKQRKRECYNPSKKVSGALTGNSKKVWFTKDEGQLQ